MIKRDQNINTIRPLRLVEELRGMEQAMLMIEDFANAKLHAKAASEIERLYKQLTALHADIRKLHIPAARGAAEIIADEIFGSDRK